MATGGLPEPAGPAAPDLAIVESRVYRGPNIWSYEPAIHLVVDLGVLEELPHQHPAGLHRPAARAAARAWPGTPARAGTRGGFVERLSEGTWLGHVAEHVALQLQQEAGHDIRAARPGGQGQPRPLQRHLRVRRRAGRPGRGPAGGPAGQPPGPARGGASTSPSELDAVPAAGRADGVRPVDRGDPRGGGQPRHPVDPAQRALPGAARPGRPPAAHPRDHDVADRRPGRRHRRRQGPHRQAARVGRAAGAAAASRCARREAAVAAADRIGYPVVVKPLDGNHGRGVCLDLSDADAVRDAFAIAEERVPPRQRHRRVVRHRPRLPLPHRRRPDAGHRRAGARPTSSATASTPCASWSTITNADPRRGVGHEKVLTRIKVDAAAVELVRRAGLRPGRRAARPARWSSSR